MCASRFQRTSREVGGDAGGEAAQNRARRFSTKQACRKTAALGFPPPAGVAPYPLGLPLRGEAGGCPHRRKVSLSCGWDNTAHD